MRKNQLAVVLLLLLLAGLFTLDQGKAMAQTATPQVETGANGIRAIGPQALTFKTLSNPYCYQPDPSLDQCLINIRYYAATDNGTSAPYMLRVAISINNKIRLVENLFFENNIYYSYDMAPSGIKVPCGAPNSGGGGTSYGNNYLVKAEPIDSTGAGMGYDQASLLCPAYAP